MDASSNSPIHYISVEAAASINAKGEFLAKGKNIQRLQLGNDSRFYPAAVITSGNLADYLRYLKGKISTLLGYTAEFKSGTDTIFVNINSVAKRLHIQPEDVHLLAKEGDLSKFIETAKKTNATVCFYDQFKSNFGNKDFPNLLDPIRENWEANKDSNKSIYHSINIENVSYHLGFDENKQFNLLFIHDVFATGSFGEIRKVDNVFDPAPVSEVLKHVHSGTSYKDEARLDIKNEYRLLIALHSEGRLWGIQAPPRQFVKIQTEKDSPPVVGYIGMRYDRDYFDQVSISVPFKERLFEFHQLIEGLKTLSDRNLLHGDLKPENILVKQDDDGTMLVHIADLGGAYQVTSTSKIEDIAGANRSHSHPYSFQEDIEISKILAAQQNKAELVILEKKRDVFSMGCILYIALTGTMPFALNEDDQNYPIIDVENYRPAKGKGIPSAMTNLITEMLQPNYQDRPTATQVSERFALILAKYPDVQLKIKQKVKSYTGSTLA